MCRGLRGVCWQTSGGEQAGQQGDQGQADEGDTAAGHELFYPQIGVGKTARWRGGGVSRNIYGVFKNRPGGAGQAVTCSTSGMGLRLK